VNRLWFVLMGRGIVHPLDLAHSGNPPSHPELLNLLANEFVASGFSVKSLLREVLLTRAYQRSSELPADVKEPPAPESYRVAILKRMSAEQLARAFLTATGNASSDDVDKALMSKFVGAFANSPAEAETEYATSVAAALFVSNDKAVLELLARKPSNLMDRLAKLSDAKAVADELYASVLSRPPEAEEVADLTRVLAHGTDRETALRELVWSLLASTEFGVNH
jgi:hypothetical protein